MGAASDRLFAEPGLAWQPVSRRLVTERRIPVAVVGLVGVVLLIAGLAAGGSGGLALAAIGAAVVLLAVAGWAVLVPRWVSAWRYAERDEDLLVSHGRLRRRLTVVPYGRMQVIEVQANPVSRRLGIATVTLVTASAHTDARIPGVAAETARELRDRLAAKGEALTAGL
ncbi:MAG TPA: PH domain-containing protein [Nocardioidaceae bacterium]|nr:PH domain-containing protein [Nocardioidaceae bacterium]